MRKKQFIGLTVLGFLVLILEISFHFYKKYKAQQPSHAIEFIPVGKFTPALEAFNPNNLNREQWEKLGFTTKQATTILNYKEKICNGSFTSKKQLSECFAISKNKFAELSPYILLPETITHKKPEYKKKYKRLTIRGKFNPDSYTLQDWFNLGFSERQSESILKYKKYLGGSFQSKEKFKECFIISEEQYLQLAPFLLLPQQKATDKTLIKGLKPKNTFDPNTLTIQEWKDLGFSERQVQGILNYKEKILKGSFKTLTDFQKCYMISAEKFEELKPWIRITQPVTTPISSQITELDLNTISFRQLRDFGFEDKAAASLLGFRKKLGGFAQKEQILETYNIDKDLALKLIQEARLDISKVNKIDILTAEEPALKGHPYFRFYADKIIFYRTSLSDKNDILKRLNAKPKDLEKILWYLK
ncbi:helix-hairpin-helix domain-containing protein [Elizabethkingia sp. HX XZB]|uniref:helix-hairpin-helix domain-containing protein n=1 Tax=Elizabethkingia sp. HX XZB TaxID=3003193 RepID=UPI002A247244|nr:helix-hairpin-helix domain-containing protein [Elizabethkingia sp. HX XZB]MDX8569772.1 helix-hairpin-helix domain-containing protein [Elizabethkingia sp. HX XZB]